MWFLGGNCEFIGKKTGNIRKKLDKPDGDRYNFFIKENCQRDFISEQEERGVRPTVSQCLQIITVFVRRKKMGKRANLRTWLVMAVLLLGLVGNASATMVGRWTFDDGTADDSSGNNHHGTLTPGDVTTSISIVYDADRDSNVLELDNPAGHFTGAVVNCGSGSWADITSQIAFTMWAKVDTKHESSYLLSKGSS